MERRGFLKGLFGGIAAGGLLVRATPAEIEAFSAPLVTGTPLMLDRPADDDAVRAVGEHLYNDRGECVAIVTEINCRMDRVEMSTTHHDYVESFPTGRMDIEIRAVGLGRLMVDQRGPMLGARRW